MVNGVDLNAFDHQVAVAQVGQRLDVGAAEQQLVGWRAAANPLDVELARIALAQACRIRCRPLRLAARSCGVEHEQRAEYSEAPVLPRCRRFPTLKSSSFAPA